MIYCTQNLLVRRKFLPVTFIKPSGAFIHSSLFFGSVAAKPQIFENAKEKEPKPIFEQFWPLTWRLTRLRYYLSISLWTSPNRISTTIHQLIIQLIWRYCCWMPSCSDPEWIELPSCLLPWIIDELTSSCRLIVNGFPAYSLLQGIDTATVAEWT